MRTRDVAQADPRQMDRFEACGRDPQRHGDGDLGLDYRMPAGKLILSAKDEAAPSFAQAQEDGLLPTWQDCQQRYRDLAV